jgi:hypothetical protein
LVAVFLIMAKPSTATLFEIDLETVGDGLVTLDDATGIMWLDLGLTTGLSHEDVVGGVGNTWYADGWRHATTVEICGLFGDYLELTAPCPHLEGSVSVQSEVMEAFFQVFEPNLNYQGNPYALSGSYGEYVPELGPGVGQASVIGPPIGDYARVERDHYGVSHDTRLIGNWLVRPVPEPNTAVLMGLGLLGLGVRKRR